MLLRLSGNVPAVTTPPWTSICFAWLIFENYQPPFGSWNVSRSSGLMHSATATIGEIDRPVAGSKGCAVLSQILCAGLACGMMAVSRAGGMSR
jgi:hypothetical protein